jgi:hypothetical protein
MERLESPFEILELDDGEEIILTIQKFQEGEMVIHPKHQEGEKVIIALRVFVPESEKTLFPYYWDLTASTLVAQLLPILKNGRFLGKQFKIKKYGVAPRARFSLEVL